MQIDERHESRLPLRLLDAPGIRLPQHVGNRLRARELRDVTGDVRTIVARAGHLADNTERHRHLRRLHREQ